MALYENTSNMTPSGDAEQHIINENYATLHITTAGHYTFVYGGVNSRSLGCFLLSDNSQGTNYWDSLDLALLPSNVSIQTYDRYIPANTDVYVTPDSTAATSSTNKIFLSVVSIA